MARRNGGKELQRVSGKSQRLSQTLPSFGGVGSELKRLSSNQSSQHVNAWVPPPQWKTSAMTSAGWLGADEENTLGPIMDGAMCPAGMDPRMSKTFSDPGLLPKIEGQRASTASGKSTDKDDESTEAKSPSVVLKRENHQLRRELEQMEVSLLESFRRGDRFMSGGKCRGNNQPVMQAYLRDKEELRRARDRAQQLEDELRRALARAEALEIERDMRGDAGTDLGELSDKAKAFAEVCEDNDMLRSVAEAQSNRALEFEAMAQRAEQAQSLALEEYQASYQAARELALQLEKERAESSTRSHCHGAIASTQTPAEEEQKDSPPKTPPKDTAALQSWVARWAGDNPRVTLGLCFHAWYREASLELRQRAAASAEELKRERDSNMRAYDESRAQLEKTSNVLEASMKDKQALEHEKKRLIEEGDEAKGMCKNLQLDVESLWQKKNVAEQALSHERQEIERLKEEMILQRRQEKSKDQQALEANELRLKKAEAAFENAQKREADLKAQLERLLAAQMKEQISRSTKSPEDLEKELKLKCEECEDIRTDREKCKNQRRRVEDRLQKLQTQFDDMQRDRERLLEELGVLQQNNAKEQLRQMFRLQVLAPSVTVSLSHMKAMDMKAAPSEGQIRKVMMERVLPQFAQVLLHDDTKETMNPNAQTSQLVQSVVSGMVSSIEDKLQSLLGTGCVRITMKT